ncbi:cyclin-dependent protein kinase inhibitor SMR4 [Ricinus communis]|uniref:Cyclin-dependent protein kinase inhibitor SMR4 n=1 Tax=Ricinus communis TaxID=3988 RepID=B9SZZ7_RICCO|nr:cyclin-dependent protein kinase inhibitor SMR4 [Ricinus communis]EEF30832.1 conserved hypothetical protein [Ricinus communis]|eukprot:XP_002531566.1 cyclin-dependent protein kinase inhibitor SMR4 [Ricinus communis]
MNIEERFRDSNGGGEECRTPRSRECRIPLVFVCPPPPRKKSATGTKRDPPKNGYFQPPDLDLLLSVPPRKAWV